MLRSAAKNFASVTVIVDPADYGRVLAALEAGDDDLDLRRLLAGEGFRAHRGLRCGDRVLVRVRALGEYFRSALRSRSSARRCSGTVRIRGSARRSTSSARRTASRRSSRREARSSRSTICSTSRARCSPPIRSRAEIACAIVKHTTPCGMATGTDRSRCLQKGARLRSGVGVRLGDFLHRSRRRGDRRSRLQSLRRMHCRSELQRGGAGGARAQEESSRPRGPRASGVRTRSITSACAEDSWRRNAPRATAAKRWRVVTRRQPSETELRDLKFAWRAVGSVKSNAIVLARDGATIGIGAGQMSRVDAAFLSVHKARLVGHDTKGSVMGSDAFFPFRDGVEQAAEAGVSGDRPARWVRARRGSDQGR